MTQYERKNLRIIYGLNNLLADLGGVMNVIVAIFGVVFNPMSKHMFYINVIKKLFLARTRDSKLLKSQRDEKGCKDEKVDTGCHDRSKRESKITKFLDEHNYPP